MRKMTQLYDTIILGAGWSGAVSAQSLAGKGYKVLILEARDRVGGRAQTWVGGGAKVDVGCSWIHGYREGNPTRGIAKSLGVVSCRFVKYRELYLSVGRAFAQTS
jgi:lysine-specific histone demethylase 1B